MGNDFPQLCHDQSQPALALGQTEPPFHFHTLTFVQKILRLVSDFVLLRPAQRGTGKPDTVLLTESQVLPAAVDLIRQNPAGIVPHPFLLTAAAKLKIIPVHLSAVGTGLAAIGRIVQLVQQLFRVLPGFVEKRRAS